MFAARTDWNLAPNRLSAALGRHRTAGRPLIDLTVSNPTECGFRYDSSAILEALANPAALRYSPEPRGLLSARQAVASYYADRGDAVDPADIFLTVSTSEAYVFIFRLLCNPGDEILIPAPSYPLFEFLADIVDVKLIRYSLLYDHGWQIDFQSFEPAVSDRVRATIVVNPNNPTGHFCKGPELARLNEICQARHMALIVDEVFLDFPLDTARRPSLSGNAAALTFTLSGLSKISGLPQMKGAWLTLGGPRDAKEQAKARLEVIADAFLSVNAPLQHALPALLAQRKDFQAQLLARARANLAELDRQVVAQKNCSRLEVEGGWNAVIRVPATRSDEDLAINLLETKGVYVHPGHFYDFSRDGYLTLSLITTEEDFSTGIKRLLSFF